MNAVKFATSLKKIFWVIAGGVVGGVTLIFISAILILLVGSVGAAYPLIGHVIEKWTFEGICAVFIIVGCIGFILGAFFSQRHLQVVQKWFSSALIEITFDPPPPRSSSIWLYWLQSRIDTQR
jgi:hypothetical protein